MTTLPDVKAPGRGRSKRRGLDSRRSLASLTGGQTVNFVVQITLDEALVGASGHHPLRSPAPAAVEFAAIAHKAGAVACRRECGR